MCADAADVQRVVRWGRKHHVRVVPRSGGHSYGGWSSGNGVVVADVSHLKRISVAGGRATIGAGARLGDVAGGLGKHGVAVPGGSCPTVGIAGLALGGGAGYSGRKLGLTSDNLRRLKLVTADGSLVVADATHHADLFWASRGGGGGNFGIATELTFATHPVSNVAVYSLEWPWEQAAAGGRGLAGVRAARARRALLGLRPDRDRPVAAERARPRHLGRAVLRLRERPEGAARAAREHGHADPLHDEHALVPPGGRALGRRRPADRVPARGRTT